ncbi:MULTISPECIES: lipoprotein [unclassified Diaphorobacter]|uniref:lipoprotein n=1 Tax=unclassified Diaphorobacter TaxID=2649760 RepID=UPI000643543C|nr:MULTISPECIES: lipoprotein [unclassified Diaphorobacter]KLR58828.1 lipoprotein [Diaphorobacter sp. J5-51]MBV2217828.1 hypothetical protein [Diaphorobacter sp.]QYY24951.1 hypothetical protein K2L43_14885 [Diaphorobacter sp. MNS-0]UOB06505.1 hypothetical protein MRB47_05170 [Diaphorobacter sp. LI3]
MKTRAWHVLGALGAAVALTACGEKPQTGGGVKYDAPPYAGTGSNFTSPDWKAGDAGSWEQKLKTRMQYGQNEYNRVR